MEAQSKIELKRQKMQVFPQGILYRVEEGHEKMLLTQSLKQKIKKKYHDVPVIGHVGVQQTVDHIKRAFLWCGLRGDVGRYAQFCPVCLVYEIRPQEKGGFIASYPLARK